jgi:hypothetical protein
LPDTTFSQPTLPVQGIFPSLASRTFSTGRQVGHRILADSAVQGAMRDPIPAVPCAHAWQRMHAVHCRSRRLHPAYQPAALRANACAGSDTFVMPKHLALKFGISTEFKAVFLEIHYNNPRGVKDAMDSSGFTIFMTTKPREHECGAWAPVHVACAQQHASLNACRAGSVLQHNCRAANHPRAPTMINCALGFDQTRARPLRLVRCRLTGSERDSVSQL